MRGDRKKQEKRDRGRDEGESAYDSRNKFPEPEVSFLANLREVNPLRCPRCTCAMRIIS